MFVGRLELTLSFSLHCLYLLYRPSTDPSAPPSAPLRHGIPDRLSRTLELTNSRGPSAVRRVGPLGVEAGFRMTPQFREVQTYIAGHAHRGLASGTRRSDTERSDVSGGPGGRLRLFQLRQMKRQQCFHQTTFITGWHGEWHCVIIEPGMHGPSHKSFDTAFLVALYPQSLDFFNDAVDRPMPIMTESPCTSWQV